MDLQKYRKHLLVALHLFFWIISINCWYVVFNPGVESAGAIKGLQDWWPELILLNFIFYLYCLLPFVWVLRNTRRWLKISATILFLIPVAYLFWDFLHGKSGKDDWDLFTTFFLSQFMYVVVFHLTIAGSVYLNLKFLIRKYLAVSKFGLYLLLVSALTIAAAVANYAVYNYGIDLLFPQLYFVSYFEMWELIFITGLYLGFTTILFLIWQYAALLISNREKVQSELSALKAQINPHFLFNNLNTIYALASKNDEKTKEVILQLSDFLRYVLYDTASEFISLEKEAEIIKTYVELQKARINVKQTAVVLTIEGSLGDCQITPLLLLPLAENCFKHGIGKKSGSIAIYLGLKGNVLHFKTVNNIAMRDESVVTENGGIGLSNVEKRLNLLYPGRHSLKFEAKEGIFTVEMQISL